MLIQIDRKSFRFENDNFIERQQKNLANIPEEVREDLTIHTVETIDEVLQIALENIKDAEILETLQIWSTDTPSADISATVE